MPKKKPLQTNMSSGELDPDIDFRQDTEQYQNGAKSLRNRILLYGGKSKRRPGSAREVEFISNGLQIEFVVNRDTQYLLVFTAGRMDAYLRNTATGVLTASGSLTSCPWTDGIWENLDWASSGNAIVLTAAGMPIQLVQRTAVATWARSAFAFFAGPGGRVEQPYIKFADADVTLTPSDVTGSITLTTSAAHWVADHDGAYIRYHGKQCLITSVDTDQQVTATVIERLPETYDLTVTASSSFAVGEIVEGSSTGARAIVTSIPDGTSIFVVLTETLIPFTTSDSLVGPQAATAISNVATATNAAVTDWDEQMFGPVYGYPTAVAFHRNRSLFGGHETLGDYVAGSVLGNIYNHNVGDGSDLDAFLEPIGDTGATKVEQFYSAEQLLVLTDAGCYYIPETPTSPLTPTNVAFFPFGSGWPINPLLKARSFDNGVIFASGSTIIKATPTGSQTKLWEAEEVSLYSGHLLSNPYQMATVENFNGRAERYCVFLNDDGTLAVMQLVEKQNIRNFVPWDTEGTYMSIAAVDDGLYALVRRTIDNIFVFWIERYDQNLTLDGVVEIEQPSDIPGIFGDTTINIVVGDQHLGTYPLTIDDMDLPDGPFNAGLNYTAQIEILPPVIEDGDGSMAGEFMRILKAEIIVEDSQPFEVSGRGIAAYKVTDDISASPNPLNGAQRFKFLGWAKDPTLVITQPDPLKLDVKAVKTVVVY